jgi:hypothetical protein
MIFRLFGGHRNEIRSRGPYRQPKCGITRLAIWKLPFPVIKAYSARRLSSHNPHRMEFSERTTSYSATPAITISNVVAVPLSELNAGLVVDGINGNKRNRSTIQIGHPA